MYKTEPIHALHIFTNGINEPYILFEFTPGLNPREKMITLEEYMNVRPGWTIECQEHDTLSSLKKDLSSHTRTPINDDLLINAKQYVANMRSGTNGAPRLRIRLTNLIEEVRKLQEKNDKLQEFAIKTLSRILPEVEQEYLRNSNLGYDDGKKYYAYLYHALQELQELIPEPVIKKTEWTARVIAVIEYKRIQVCKYTAPEHFKNDLMHNLIDPVVTNHFNGRIIELWPNPTNDNSQPRSKIADFAISHQKRRGELPFERASDREANALAAAREAAAAAAAEAAALQAARRAEYPTLSSKFKYLGSAALRAASSTASSTASSAANLALRAASRAANLFRGKASQDEIARSASPPRHRGGKSKHVKRVKRSRRVKSSTKRRRN